MNGICYTIINALITAIVAVPVGFFVYYLIYYRVTNRKQIKCYVLNYLEFVNLNYDTNERDRTRLVFSEDGKPVDLSSSPVYPNVRAVMNWVHHTPEIQRGIKFGFKYDEDFFMSILSELIMEGRAEAIHDIKTDEMIGFKYIGHKI